MRSLSPCLILIVALVFAACGDAQTTYETQTAEPTPLEPDVRTEEVDYTAGDVTMKGYLAYDANKEGQRPGVLVVHEWWGHNEYARRRARMLAELGYTALAVDMYGDGKTAGHPDEAGAFMTEVVSNMDLGQARFEAAMEVLVNHDTTDPEYLAAIGYCFGGAVVLHMARRGLDLDGVVSFHGALNTEEPADSGTVSARILVLHGADDEFIPQEVVDGFKQEMDDAGAAYEFIAYPGATHSFTNPEADSAAAQFGLPVAYNAEADARSWEAMEYFFRAIFYRSIDAVGQRETGAVKKWINAVRNRETGTVKWFSADKGYGFITHESGGDVFVHWSEIRIEGYRTLEEGRRVEFTLVEDDRGPRAQDVDLVNE